MASFYRDANNQPSLLDNGFCIEWAERASSLVLQEIETPHEDNIVTLLNLALFWYSRGEWRRCYVHKGTSAPLVGAAPQYHANGEHHRQCLTDCEPLGSGDRETQNCSWVGLGGIETSLLGSLSHELPCRRILIRRRALGEDSKASPSMARGGLRSREYQLSANHAGVRV